MMSSRYAFQRLEFNGQWSDSSTPPAYIRASPTGLAAVSAGQSRETELEAAVSVGQSRETELEAAVCHSGSVGGAVSLKGSESRA